MSKNHLEVKEEHLKLLSRMYVDWQNCEFGAPAIDCKRPYGNSSVIQDMREILGLEEDCCSHCRGELKTAQISDEQLTILHTEMQDILQIMIDVLPDAISLGWYKKEPIVGRWAKIKEA
jgi:hypothetical protein